MTIVSETAAVEAAQLRQRLHEAVSDPVSREFENLARHRARLALCPPEDRPAMLMVVRRAERICAALQPGEVRFVDQDRA